MLSLEEWRKEPYPLLAYYGWKSAYPKSLLNNKSTYILNIILEKKKTITLGIYDIIIKNIYKSLVFFIPKRYRKGLTYIGWRYIIYKIFKANDK